MQLASGGPQSIKGLSERAPVSRQAVAEHLYLLSDAGLLRISRRGRHHIWAIASGRLVDARAYLDWIDADWNAALGRLRAFVEQN